MYFLRNLFKKDNMNVMDMYFEFLNSITTILQQSKFANSLQDKNTLLDLFACTYVITDSLLAALSVSQKIRHDFLQRSTVYFLVELTPNEYGKSKPDANNGTEIEKAREKFANDTMQELTNRTLFYSKFISSDKPCWGCEVYIDEEIAKKLLPQDKCFVAFCDILINPEWRGDYGMTMVDVDKVCDCTTGLCEELSIPAFAEIGKHIKNICKSFEN